MGVVAAEDKRPETVAAEKRDAYPGDNDILMTLPMTFQGYPTDALV